MVVSGPCPYCRRRIGSPAHGPRDNHRIGEGVQEPARSAQGPVTGPGRHTGPPHRPGPRETGARGAARRQDGAPVPREGGRPPPRPCT
ncbi:hypothetical protein GCM10009602_30570 [Nocardiopsis tropica]